MLDDAAGSAGLVVPVWFTVDGLRAVRIMDAVRGSVLTEFTGAGLAMLEPLGQREPMALLPP